MWAIVVILVIESNRQRTMGTFVRVRSILSKAISILVILINVALMTFVWIVQDDVSSSAVVVFSEVDNLTQIMRSGIARVEPPISNLRELFEQVETASSEIALNVSEEGIIPRLLPQTVVDNLTASSQSLRDNFTAVYDLLGATSDLLLALDKMPFVEIPARGLSTIETLQENMQEIVGQVETLQNNINDVRGEAGAKISRVTDAAVFLSAEVDQFNDDLTQIDSDLNSIQISVRKFQRLTRPVVISSVIILSLISAWVVYSQVVMILHSAKLDRLANNKHGSVDQEPPLDEGMDG
jgi:peptidoglycan hydrolase CwlO-like protein